MEDADGVAVHADGGDGDLTGCVVGAGVEQGRGLAHHQGHAPGSHGMIGQAVLHGLEAADGLAEGDALAGVGDGAVDHALHAAHRVGGEKEAVEVERHRSRAQGQPLARVDGDRRTAAAHVEGIGTDLRGPGGAVRVEGGVARGRVDHHQGLGTRDAVDDPGPTSGGVEKAEGADDLAAHDASQQRVGLGPIGGGEGVARRGQTGEGAAVERGAELLSGAGGDGGLQAVAVLLLGDAERRQTELGEHRPTGPPPGVRGRDGIGIGRAQHAPQGGPQLADVVVGGHGGSQRSVTLVRAAGGSRPRHGAGPSAW